MSPPVTSTPYGSTELSRSRANAMVVAWSRRDAEDQLARIVDTRWDPPVTASVRLVSLIGDGLKHLGQAQYVRGLAKRAGIG